VNLKERQYGAYIFDLDGTIYLGESLLPTVESTIRRLRAMGSRILFLSNNPTQSHVAYAAKLTRLGLSTLPEEVLNSSIVMVDFLQRRMPGATLFVVGEESLCCELQTAGFFLSDDAKRIEAVIASFDRTFTYRKLQIAFDALRVGAHFYATNADRFCPVPGGGEPDAAAVIAAIEACTNRRIEAVVGKPSEHMVAAILARLDLPAGECLVVGDRLETDVKMGLDAGMDTALVLTGATSISDVAVSSIRPTRVILQLSDLLAIPDRE